MAKHDDFWTINNSIAFGMMPGGIINGINDPLPICLQRGQPTWGSVHISKRHGRFITQNSVGSPPGHGVPWLIWKKMGQSGAIWTTEDDGKLKIALSLSPNALLLLKYNAGAVPFFGITTIYPNPSRLDGQNIGRYQGQRWAGPPPVFYLPP